MEGFLRLPSGIPSRPGEERAVAVLGRRILLRRLADGSLLAMELACRHQNADLSGAERRGGRIVCPRHGWMYELETGACLNEPWAALRRFETRELDGALWISIRPSE